MAVPVVLGDALCVRAVEEDLSPEGTRPQIQGRHQHAQLNPKPPHGDNLGIQFDSQVFLGQRFMNGGELIVGACFDGALAFEVNDHGALFGLQRVMPACGDEAVNHVVKRVVVVVEQHHIPVPVKGDFRQDVFLGFNCAGGDEAVHRVLRL